MVSATCVAFSTPCQPGYFQNIAGNDTWSVLMYFLFLCNTFIYSHLVFLAFFHSNPCVAGTYVGLSGSASCLPWYEWIPRYTNEYCIVKNCNIPMFPSINCFPCTVPRALTRIFLANRRVLLVKLAGCHSMLLHCRVWSGLSTAQHGTKYCTTCIIVLIRYHFDMLFCPCFNMLLP